jgi:hypothetical protein
MGDVLKFPEPRTDCVIRQHPDGTYHVMLDIALSAEDTLFVLLAIRALERRATIRLGKEVRLPFGIS